MEPSALHYHQLLKTESVNISLLFSPCDTKKNSVKQKGEAEKKEEEEEEENFAPPPSFLFLCEIRGAFLGGGRGRVGWCPPHPWFMGGRALCFRSGGGGEVRESSTEKKSQSPACLSSASGSGNRVLTGFMHLGGRRNSVLLDSWRRGRGLLKQRSRKRRRRRFVFAKPRCAVASRELSYTHRERERREKRKFPTLPLKY